MMGLKEGLVAYLIITIFVVLLTIGTCYFYNLNEVETSFTIVVAVYAFFGGIIIDLGKS